MIKNLFFKTALYFVFITYFISLGAMLASQTTTPSMSWLFAQINIYLLFSLIISLSDFIFMIKNINKGILRIIHFIINYANFFFCFLLLTNLIYKPLNILVGSIIYFILYFVILFFIFIVKKIIERKKIDESDYIPQLKNTK